MDLAAIMFGLRGCMQMQVKLPQIMDAILHLRWPSIMLRVSATEGQGFCIIICSDCNIYMP